MKNRITAINPIREWQYPYPPTLEELNLDTADVDWSLQLTEEDYQAYEKLQERERAAWLRECL